jgi:DNA-binding GntR family transcriptional regulator
VTLPKFNAPDLGNAPSTSEIITRHLRDAIVAGHFAEDEPIRQDDIARQFNVSKIPVREALKRLEAEGLVMFQRNRGAMVTRVSDAELAQMFEVRMLLEDKVLRLAIPNMTEETFARAERICQEFIGEDDVGRWAELNWELHACLYEPAQRPFLVGLIRSVNDKLERYLRMQMSLSAGKDRADHEHREILAACRAGDVDLAVKLLDEHCRGLQDPVRAPASPPLTAQLTVPISSSAQDKTLKPAHLHTSHSLVHSSERKWPSHETHHRDRLPHRGRTYPSGDRRFS